MNAIINIIFFIKKREAFRVKRNISSFSSSAGISLIEILVTALIFSLIIVAIFGVLEMGNRTFPNDLGLLDLQQQARQGMDRMIREIRQSSASGVSIGGGGANITFSIPNITSIYYYLDTNSHRIIRQQPKDTGSTKILANDIDSLSFSLSAGVVEILLVGEKTALNKELCFPSPCQNPKKTLKEKVKLRNE